MNPITMGEMRQLLPTLPYFCKPKNTLLKMDLGSGV